MTMKGLPSSDETMFNVNYLKISQIWHTMKILFDCMIAKILKFFNAEHKI